MGVFIEPSFEGAVVVVVVIHKKNKVKTLLQKKMFGLLLWMLVSGVGGKSNQLRATVHYRLIVGLVRNIAFVLFDFDFDCCFLSFFCLNKIVSRQQLSAPNNFESRNACRTTWFQLMAVKQM